MPQASSRTRQRPLGCSGCVRRSTCSRIGHLGAPGELEVLAALGGVEMALRECGHTVAAGSGVATAEERFVSSEKTAEASLRT